MPVYTTLFSRIITCCLIGFLPIVLSAQHYTHSTFWGRLIVATPLSNNWDIQFEYVHRSQNNYRESKWNPFGHEALEEPRLWFNFKQKNYTVFLNPITYYYSLPMLGKEADFNIKPNTIWQACVGIEAKQNIKKWTIKERMLYEYRFLKSLNYVPVGRVRLRALVQYALTDKTKLQAYSDVFLNTPPHRFPYLFDQNWSLMGLSHQFTPKFTMELGYMRNHRVRLNRIEFDEENAVNMAFNFKL